jgi:hypothetical protein
VCESTISSACLAEFLVGRTSDATRGTGGGGYGGIPDGYGAGMPDDPTCDEWCGRIGRGSGGGKGEANGGANGGRGGSWDPAGPRWNGVAGGGGAGTVHGGGSPDGRGIYSGSVPGGYSSMVVLPGVRTTIFAVACSMIVSSPLRWTWAFPYVPPGTRFLFIGRSTGDSEG